jgi:hypothetical protein
MRYGIFGGSECLFLAGDGAGASKGLVLHKRNLGTSQDEIAIYQENLNDVLQIVDL